MKVRDLLDALEGVDPETEIDVEVAAAPYDNLPWVTGFSYHPASHPGNRNYFQIDVEVYRL